MMHNTWCIKNKRLDKQNGQNEMHNLITVLSLEDMVHDLILGHNRCLFSYFGRVHPTDKKSA